MNTINIHSHRCGIVSVRWLRVCALFLVCAVVFGLYAACDGDPLLTELTTTNTNLYIKGTYESNNPRPWWGGSEPSAEDIRDDSAIHIGPQALPTVFLIDMGEIYINSTMFTSERMYHFAKMTDEDPFFDGRGVRFNSEDLSPGKSYSKFGIYFRKLLFDEAYSYSSEWTDPNPLKTQFERDKIDGYNFVNRMEYVFSVDNDSETLMINPLSVKTGKAMEYEIREDFVMEIRFAVKNNIKSYELHDVDDGVFYSHYAFGDTVCPVDAPTGDNEGIEHYIGGNLVSGFHWYIRGKTAVISGSAPANRMVVAIPESCTIDDYSKTALLPDLATWCADGSYRLENARVGETYKVYYSTNTPDALKAELPESFDGEVIVEISPDDTGKEITANLN